MKLILNIHKILYDHLLSDFEYDLLKPSPCSSIDKQKLKVKRFAIDTKDNNNNSNNKSAFKNDR